MRIELCLPSRATQPLSKEKASCGNPASREPLPAEKASIESADAEESDGAHRETICPERALQTR
jgi:hypothetical protein